MKLINKILLCICIIFLLEIIISCGFNIWQKNIYNNNEKILQQRDTYTFRNRICNQNNNKSIDLKYNGFSGDETIWILQPKEESEITVNYDSTVNNGDFKVVLVNIEKGQIENISEGTEQGSKTINLTKEDYRIKIVGENAEGQINFSINENRNIDIRKKN